MLQPGAECVASLCCSVCVAFADCVALCCSVMVCVLHSLGVLQPERDAL